MQRISISNKKSQFVPVFNSPAQNVSVENSHTVVIGADPYDGEYTFTPSASEQTIECEGKTMRQNVIINPIPSNYGFVSYNGYELTIS